MACSRPRTFNGLHILNFNENALAVDEKVNVEMSRLRNDSILDLCYIPLYDVDSTQFKIVLNNVRSLHKHISDIKHDQNLLCADIIGLAETRLCENDEDRLYEIAGYDIVRNDQDRTASLTRPHHGLIMYVRTDSEIHKIHRYSSSNFEFIFASVSPVGKGHCQVLSIQITQVFDV